MAFLVLFFRVVNLSEGIALYVFGPGHAKTEFKKHLEANKHMAPPILKLESADKMTNAQLVAKVKSFSGEIPGRPYTQKLK